MSNEESVEMEGRPQARVVTEPTAISDEEMQLILEMRKNAAARTPHASEPVVAPVITTQVDASVAEQALDEVPVRAHDERDLLVADEKVRIQNASIAPVVVVEPEPEPQVEAVVAQPVVTEPVPAIDPEPELPEAPMASQEDEGKTIYRGFSCRIDPGAEYKPEMSGLVKSSILLTYPMLGSFTIPPSYAQNEFNRMMIGAQIDPRSGEPKYLDEEQENTARLIGAYSSNHAPSYPDGSVAQERAMFREGVSWDQRLKLPNGQQMAMVRSHSAADTTLAGRIRRAKGSGAPITLYMPKSGFHVSYRIPKEREFCELDIALVAETSRIGTSSYGMLLSASSGIYLKHMIMHVMQYVTGTTLNMEGGDMITTILANLDMQDAGLFILGPIIAKYPHGLPWELACPMEDCLHVRQVNLNLARCVRPGNGLFTSEQLDFIVRTRGQLITSKEVAQYRDSATVPESHRYQATLPDGSHVTVHWGHATALEYFDHSNEWVETNNTITNSAMMQNSTEAARERHLRIVADQRRLLRHMHFIKSVEWVDAEGGSVLFTERKDVVDALEELSEDREYVNSFEAALSKYIEDCRLYIVGYMVDECPSCKRSDGGEKGTGPFRGMVSLSPDRIFFTLSRAVSGIQEQLAEVYEGIG